VGSKDGSVERGRRRITIKGVKKKKKPIKTGLLFARGRKKKIRKGGMWGGRFEGWGGWVFSWLYTLKPRVPPHGLGGRVKSVLKGTLQECWPRREKRGRGPDDQSDYGSGFGAIKRVSRYGKHGAIGDQNVGGKEWDCAHSTFALS